MTDEGERPAAREGITRLLEMGAAYYRRFHFLDGPNVGDSSPIFVRGAGRISNTSTFFAIANVVVEIANLRGFEATNAALTKRVADSFFRGGRDHVDRCIDAMSNAGLVTRDKKLINIRSRAQCTFTSDYVDQIREYSTDIFQIVLGHRNAPARWQSISHAFFDFMQFRCIPEWYLLVRRTLRASRLTDKMKDEVSDDLFNNPGIWFAVNYYILSQSQTQDSEITPERFVNMLTEKLRVGEDYIRDAMDVLFRVGFIGSHEGHLRIESPVQGLTEEYAAELDHEYGRLRNSLLALRPAD